MRFLKIKLFVLFITLCAVISCRRTSNQLFEINGKQIAIDSSLIQTDSINNYIEPYRKRVNEVMDAPLAYAPKMLTKEDGQFNTSAGNLLADAILEQASPIFESRTGKPIDFVVFNHGGIRSIVSKGQVTTRTAYQIMPFENRIAVVEMSGSAVREMIHFLVNSGRAHPVAGIQIIVDKDDSLDSVNISGAPFDEDRTYFVATSDYLVQGGDDMGFFRKRSGVDVMEYLVRNALIDYFKAHDTLKNAIDDRFIKL